MATPDPTLIRVADVERLYAERGDLSYGEDVTQREHALQCAAGAEAALSSPSLIVAALLHDVGHLLLPETPAVDQDGRHEVLGARALRRLFPPSVVRPIALHVVAKRYLCHKDPGAVDRLSAMSRRTLAQQGGPLRADQARRFEASPFFVDALALRRFDDGGKTGESASARFADFAPLVRRVAGGGG